MLSRVSGEARVAKAVELSEMAKAIFKQGLRERFPAPSDADSHKLYLARLAKCHNRNW